MAKSKKKIDIFIKIYEYLNLGMKSKYKRQTMMYQTLYTANIVLKQFKLDFY